jgi:hypothetical protein
MKVLGTIALLLALFAPPALAQAPVASCLSQVNNAGCAALIVPLGMASAVEGSRILKATAGTLAGFSANNTNAAARWILLFDSATVPSDGAVTGCTNAQSTRPCVARSYQIPANNTIGVTWAPGPFPRFLAGITLVCSTTGPFTKTVTSDCTFAGEVQ